MRLLTILLTTLPAYFSINCYYCHPDFLQDECIWNTTCRGDMCTIVRPFTAKKNVMQYCTTGNGDEVVGCWEDFNGNIECNCREEKCNSWEKMKKVSLKKFELIECQSWDESDPPRERLEYEPKYPGTCTGSMCKNQIQITETENIRATFTQRCDPDYGFSFLVTGASIGFWRAAFRMNACYKWVLRDTTTDEIVCKCNTSSCNEPYIPYPVADGPIECYRTADVPFEESFNDSAIYPDLTCHGHYCVIIKSPQEFVRGLIDPLPLGNSIYYKGCLSLNETKDKIMPGVYIPENDNTFYFLCDEPFCNKDQITATKSIQLAKDIASGVSTRPTTTAPVTVALTAAKATETEQVTTTPDQVGSGGGDTQKDNLSQSTAITFLITSIILFTK